MHDRLAELLVRDSGTSNLDGELGSCVMGLTLHNSLVCHNWRQLLVDSLAESVCMFVCMSEMALVDSANSNCRRFCSLLDSIDILADVEPA